MLGTQGYHIKPMTRKEFLAHPDRAVSYNTLTGKYDIPLLYQGDKRPIRVQFTD